MDCSKIQVGFSLEECQALAVPGTGPRVILLNFSDIDKSKSVAGDSIISSIVLKQGTKGYEVESLPNATVGSDSINVGTYVRTHAHNVIVRIFQKSEAAKKFVNGLTNAKVVAIVENNEHGIVGEVKYEVYGWDSGLGLSDLTTGTDMADNVVYQATLASDSNAPEKTLPKSFYSENEAATDAAITALLSPAA
jgi:hypothetical protein|uniref:Major tail protein n=1 Tax=Siphoviridae sp. ct3b712 TaxID=2826283 RepID=A0A8S5M4B1_9CAUD|nr:MAG TPA: hypothetical protein [Siphoviridae sp. ct3b712]